MLTCLIKINYLSYAHIKKVTWAKLNSLGKIHRFFILGDTIKIRVSENSPSLSLTHVDDFGKYLSKVDLSPPACSDKLNPSVC